MHSSFGYRGSRMEYEAGDSSSRRPPSFAKKRRSVPYRYSRCAGVQSEVKSALALKPNIQYSGSSLKRSRLLWRMTSVYSAKVLSSLRISRSQREARSPSHHSNHLEPKGRPFLESRSGEYPLHLTSHTLSQFALRYIKSFLHTPNSLFNRIPPHTRNYTHNNPNLTALLHTLHLGTIVFRLRPTALQ